MRRRRAAFRKIRAADAEAASYDPRQPKIKIPRKVHQGRLASLRAELLPPLPPGRAPCGSGGYVDESRRISMRHQNRERLMSSEDARKISASLKNGALNRRNMLLASTTIAAASALGSVTGVEKAIAQAQSAPSGAKPNILVIMGDDVGWFNIGAYHRGIMSGKTPNLDKLAARRHDIHRLLRRGELHRGSRQFHHRRTAAAHRSDHRRPGRRRRRHPRSGGHNRHRRSSRSAMQPGSSARTISAT